MPLDLIDMHHTKILSVSNVYAQTISHSQAIEVIRIQDILIATLL